MKLCRTFNRRTRRGKVFKELREVYLRDDISCCSALCEVCPSSSSAISLLSEDAYDKTYKVLDTNVVLHQIDLLEQEVAPLCNVVILQTVLEEVRARSLPIYNRLHSLLRNPSRHFVLFSNEHRKDTFGSWNVLHPVDER